MSTESKNERDFSTVVSFVSALAFGAMLAILQALRFSRPQISFALSIWTPRRRNYNMITSQRIAIVGGTAGIGLGLARMAANAGAEVHLGGSTRTKPVCSRRSSVRGTSA